MLREGASSWNNGSEAYGSDLEEEMVFGDNKKDACEMMDMSDLPTSLFACGVHEAVFEEVGQWVRISPHPPPPTEAQMTQC